MADANLKHCKGTMGLIIRAHKEIYKPTMNTFTLNNHACTYVTVRQNKVVAFRENACVACET